MNNSSRSNPLNSPDAAALLKDKSALKKLLASPCLLYTSDAADE